MHTRLVEILKALSYRRMRVTLASGRESDFYVDGKQTTLNAEGAWIVGNLMFEALLPDVVGIGGLVVGADPVAAATAAVSFHRGRGVHAFLVRKEAKGHGTGRYVEGRASLPEGSKVCIVEDTVTTGASLLQAVGRCRDEGLDVVQALAIVDREEGGAEVIRAMGLPFTALVRRAQLEV